MGHKYFKILTIFLGIIIWGTVVFSESLIKEDLYQGLKMGQQGDFIGAKIFFINVLAKDLLNIPAKRSLDLIRDYKLGMVKIQTVLILFKGIEDFYKYKYNSAINMFKQAIKLNPEYYMVYHNLGSAYFQDGQNTKAIRTLKYTLKLNPRYPYTHNNLGLALHRSGNPYEAIKHYKKAILLDSSYYKVYNNLAVSLWNIKKFDKANAMFRKALKINPNYTLAYKNIHLDDKKDINKIERIQSYSIDEVINLLVKGNWQERKIATQILSHHTNPEINDRIIKLLEHPNSIIRVTAVKILGNLRTPSVLDSLLEHISEKDWSVRAEIPRSLGLIGDIRALPALHHYLLEDKDYHVRIKTAVALYRIKDPTSLLPLEKALQDRIYNVREIVLWVLANGFDSNGYYQRLYNERKGKHHKTYSYTRQPEQKPQQPTDIQSLIVNGDWFRIIQIGQPAVDHLLEIIKTQNPDFHLEAIMALGEIGGEKTIETLINQLGNQSPDVRFYAAEALGKIGDRKTVPMLIELVTDPHWNVRHQAAESLSFITEQFFGENQEEWRQWWEENQ